jgi:hypothetical protein
MQNQHTDHKKDFESAATEERTSFLSEFVYFLKENKKWWLIPILLIISLLALLSFFTGSGAAPFIYTLF